MKKLVSFILGLALLGSVSAYAAFPASVKIDQTFSDGEELSVIFHAGDGSGADLPDLAAENVSLTLGGRTLPAQLEPANARGVGCVFAVDVSSTLSEEQFSPIRESLKSWIAAMGLRDRAAIVTFGSQVDTVMELTDNVTTLLMALDGLRPADPEAMVCGGAVRALEVAAAQADGLPRRRVVVLVSAGASSASDTADMDQVRTRAVESGVPLYAAEASGADNGVLAALSDAVLASGGRVEMDAKETLAGGVDRLRAYINGGTRAVAAIPEDLAGGGAKTLELAVTSAGVSVSDRRDISPEAASGGTAAGSAGPETGTDEEPKAGDGEEKKFTLAWDAQTYVPLIAAGGAGAVLALLVVAIVSGAKKRKARKQKTTEAAEHQDQGNGYQPPEPPENHYHARPTPVMSARTGLAAGASANAVQFTQDTPDNGKAPLGQGDAANATVELGQAAPADATAELGQNAPVNATAELGQDAPATMTVELGKDSPAKKTTPSASVSSRMVLTDNQNRRAYSARFQDRVTVGRGGADGADRIVLRDENVADDHCEIFRDGSRVIVRDLRSANGTILRSNGVRYAVDADAGRELRVGDTLEVGRTALEVTSL